MTQDMLEKVSRAICEADGVDPEKICFGLGKIIPEGEKWPAWKVRTHQAQAALSAIEESHVVVPLEPTEEMLRAAMGHVEGAEHQKRQMLEDRNTYKAMISAHQQRERTDG